jgi:transglutaminase-like putative cysteine protease
MSSLVANETGRLIVTLGEEVGGRRQARTTLELDSGPATLYVLARAHRADGPPLDVSVGGAFVGAIAPRADPVLTWHELELPAGIASGPTMVTLSAGGDGRTSWSLGVDYTGDGGDELSLDRGETWSSERIGYLHVAPGRYVVRARKSTGSDPVPPRQVWETPTHPAAQEFLSYLPQAARDAKDPLTAVQILSTWVADSWRYRNTSEALQYAPWDPITILDWGKRNLGHAGYLPVVMCVHFAVVFVSACQVLGIPARCAPLTGAKNSLNGHFVAEVWMERWGRWVMVDPNFDLTIEGPDGPADLRTIRELGDDLKPYVKAGKGIESHLAVPAERTWFENILLKGVVYRDRALWPRSDFLSRPELAPPGHGAAGYSELELVWESRSADRGFGMFQYFGDEAWFDAPPDFSA